MLRGSFPPGPYTTPDGCLDFSRAPEIVEDDPAQQAAAREVWLEFEEERIRLEGAWGSSPVPGIVDRLARGQARELPEAPGTTLRFDLHAWDARTRFVGPAPPMRWLLSGVAPVGVAGMVCSMGGVGKSFLLLELAFRVAYGSCIGDQPILGGQVERHGAVVFLTAEEDEAEVHRRIEAIDPDGKRRQAGRFRLSVVPLPSAGGPVPLIVQGRDGVALTPAFDELAELLNTIPDLALVILDPLQTFAYGDINADPTAGQILFSGLARLAGTTGATVIVAHHMRKPSKPVVTRADARDAIRGTTALVDGGRFTVAIWPAPSAKEVLRNSFKSRAPDEEDAVFHCAVVKGNAGQSKAVRTLVRDVHTGLLKDVTGLVEPVARWSAPEMDQLRAAVAAKAEAGYPFTVHGKNGLHYRRHELGHPLMGFAKAKLPEMAQALLSDGRLVQARHGNGSIQYLDVPDGRFARGMGYLAQGASGKAPTGS